MRKLRERFQDIERIVSRYQYDVNDIMTPLKRNIAIAILAFAQCHYNCEPEFIDGSWCFVFTRFIDKCGKKVSKMILLSSNPEMLYDDICDSIGI